MLVMFIKDFNGHKKGEAFETNGAMGRYLIKKNIAMQALRVGKEMLEDFAVTYQRQLQKEIEDFRKEQQ